jgi:hypothetical protein
MGASDQVQATVASTPEIELNVQQLKLVAFGIT